MSTTFKIAHWTFAPETGVLENDAATTRLEHRTAALLNLLVRHAGRLVSHDEIIAQVWDGRTVSPNSVAVVISDIRRALGDDPKAPTYVETLPKRGYRLIAEARPMVGEAVPADTVEHDGRFPRPPLLALAALALITVLVFSMGNFYNRQSADLATLSVNVSAAVNDTGDTQYDPLTASVTELLAVELAQHDVVNLSTTGDAKVVVTGKLILWDGHPSMSIYAHSASTGDVIWSGMASGPETLLPRQVRQEISEFAEFARSEQMTGS